MQTEAAEIANEPTAYEWAAYRFCQKIDLERLRRRADGQSDRLSGLEEEGYTEASVRVCEAINRGVTFDLDGPLEEARAAICDLQHFQQLALSVMRRALPLIEGLCDEIWTDIGAARQEGGYASADELDRARELSRLVRDLNAITPA